MSRARKKNDTEAVGIIININPEWRLLYDGTQFHVQKGRVRKDGKQKGEEVWVSQAYICELDNAIIWLASKQIYCIPGTYEIEALEHLCNALDQIKADCRLAVQKGINAIQESQELSTVH